MNPEIEKSSFGSITIGGEVYDFDVLIRLNGTVQKRKKKLSKQIYGTSHTISLDEAKHIYQDGAQLLLIGGGLFNRVNLSKEAAGFFAHNQVQVRQYATPKAIKQWNRLQGNAIALFHITC